MPPGKRAREVLERALDVEKLASGRYELDPDTLECPICTEPLCPPVFQCLNGHTSCSSCCKKLANRCPSCSQPIGSNRCIAVEKILESLHVRCKNALYGCNEILKFGARREHENVCIVPFAAQYQISLMTVPNLHFPCTWRRFTKCKLCNSITLEKCNSR